MRRSISVVWKKRLRKLRGQAVNLYSLCLLRYTGLRRRMLMEFFHKHPVQRLHVGCGETLLPGWCNIFYDRKQEYGKLKKINGVETINFNLLRPWPWPENSVKFIAGAHFIEHLDLNKCLQFCEQAYKVLKPGGVLRLSCPDLEAYACAYVQNDKSFYQHPQIIEGCAFKSAQTFSQIFAAKAYDCGVAHRWFHDASSLINVLQRCGFVNTVKVKRLQGKTPDLEKLELVQREIQTVYVEAEKIEG
jgi:predicted SAM-dependent methyltransferase